jgi:hypothetical protein
VEKTSLDRQEEKVGVREMELSGDLEVAVVDHVCKRETRRTQKRFLRMYRNSKMTKMTLLQLLSLSKISLSLRH